jgi:hypothetical protein
MRLRQPNLKALAFQESRQLGVEALLRQREQGTGQIEFGHDRLRSK